MRECFAQWPLTVNAMRHAHHLHAIWTLPTGDDGYPKRWGWTKKKFTKRLSAGIRSEASHPQISPARKRRRGIWQPRYWEHTLEDVEDFERHFDYIHWNSVKHGHVACPHEWPHSTFHRYVEHRGVYDRQWGCFRLRCSASMISATPPANRCRSGCA